MRLLLDTHALLWTAHEPAKLSIKAMRAIAAGENDIFVSAVSAMEIATKSRCNRLEYSSRLTDDFVAEVTARGFELLVINCDHAERAGGYRSENQDPWDRLLAAQAEIDRLMLVSCDAKMTGFGITPFW